MVMWEGNVVFMTGGGDDPTMKGEMTDINVWDRLLNPEEVNAFHQCENLEGNVVSWKNASLNIVNLEQSEVDKSKVCFKSAARYKSFLNTENYRDSQIFCYKIGGEMAEARDKKTLDEMVSAFTGLQVHSNDRAEHFYSGHSDQEQEGAWLGGVSGDTLAWDNWEEGYPSDVTQGSDCSTTGSGYDWKFVDDACSVKLRPICEFKNDYQTFKLFGIPEKYQVDLDVNYFLINSTHLEGYLREVLRIFFLWIEIYPFMKKKS